MLSTTYCGWSSLIHLFKTEPSRRAGTRKRIFQVGSTASSRARLGSAWLVILRPFADPGFDEGKFGGRKGIAFQGHLQTNAGVRTAQFFHEEAVLRVTGCNFAHVLPACAVA